MAQLNPQIFQHRLGQRQEPQEPRSRPLQAIPNAGYPQPGPNEFVGNIPRHDQPMPVNVPYEPPIAVPQQPRNGPPNMHNNERLYSNNLDEREYFLNPEKKPYNDEVKNGNSSIFHDDYITLLDQGSIYNNHPGVYPISNQYTHKGVIPETYESRDSWHDARKAVEKVILRQADCNYWLFYIYQKLEHFQFNVDLNTDAHRNERDPGYVEDLRIGTFGVNFLEY